MAGLKLIVLAGRRGRHWHHRALQARVKTVYRVASLSPSLYRPIYSSIFSTLTTAYRKRKAARASLLVSDKRNAPAFLELDFVARRNSSTETTCRPGCRVNRRPDATSRPSRDSGSCLYLSVARTSNIMQHVCSQVHWRVTCADICAYASSSATNAGRSKLLGSQYLAM